MISKLSISNKSLSDILGSSASTLCLIHCIATPFLFFTQATSASLSSHAHAPIWWNMIDVILLIVSLAAVYWTSKNTKQMWIRYSLYANWTALAALIITERLELIHISEWFIYIPAVGLIFLHEYNRRFCACKGDSCCTNEFSLDTD